MILVTVGTQLPFDRLISAVDDLAPSLPYRVIAQVGNTQITPKNIAYFSNMDPREFDARFAEARIIISHAGIGTVLTARRHGKPIILVPRRVSYGEHRNDHQLATCDQLRGQSGIFVVDDIDGLSSAVDAAAHFKDQESDALSSDRRAEFVRRLSEYVLTDQLRG